MSRSDGLTVESAATFAPAARPARAQPLPLGVGLLVGAGVSIALWAGLVGGLMALLG